MLRDLQAANEFPKKEKETREPAGSEAPRERERKRSLKDRSNPPTSRIMVVFFYSHLPKRNTAHTWMKKIECNEWGPEKAHSGGSPQLLDCLTA